MASTPRGTNCSSQIHSTCPPEEPQAALPQEQCCQWGRRAEPCWDCLLPAAKAARAFVKLARNGTLHFSCIQILQTQPGQRRLNLKTQEPKARAGLRQTSLPHGAAKPPPCSQAA